MKRRLCTLAGALPFACVALAFGQTDSAPEHKRLAEGVQDNSFLIEEAYNQEVGVVQHILNVIYTNDTHASPDEHMWSFVFTQEWPAFSQSHQLSYTLPYSYLERGGHSTDGINDILLNYRYQALTESDTMPAFAPRLSLVLPTGDADKGFGNGVVGYQTSLPFSKIVNERTTVHFNAGATFSPDVESHDLLSYNLGASAVYAVTSTFNLMLESTVNWTDEVNDRGHAERTVSAVISPGFRYAIDHKSIGAQTVFGIAAPIGLNSNTPNYGVFLYASFEHYFHRSKNGGGAK